MNKFYQVLSQLKFGDTVHKVGAFIEGAEHEYGPLVKDKVLRMIEGAKSAAHAAEIVAQEVADSAQKEQETAAKAPQDTWGPQSDNKPAPVPETAPVGAGEASGGDQQSGAPEAPVPAKEVPPSIPSNLDAGLNGDNL